MTGELARPSRGVPRLALAAALLLLPWLGFAPTAQAQQPRVECTLAQELVFEGEPVDYQVAVLDAEASPPDLAAFTDFDVADAGSRSVSSSHMTIVNGRMSRVERVGMEYHYQLTPRRSGALTVPAPTVTADGKRYAGNVLKLTVTPPDDQGRLRLRLTVEPQELYPQQEAKLRLTIAVRRPAGSRDERDPVALLSQLESFEPPMLRLPWLELGQELGADGWQEWLSPRMVRGGRGGFAINELKAQGAPLLLFDDRPRFALFELGGRPAQASDAPLLDGLEGEPADWFVYQLERRLLPTAVGRFDFAPVTLKGRFIASLEGRRANLSDLFSRSDAATLIVREPPLEGRPPEWSGAIGRFLLAAEVSPRQARVGDPLTLTLRVAGTGNQGELVAPELADRPEFVSAFRVHPGTAETKDGQRVFTWSLRPLAASVTAVPPIRFAWFDPVERTYVTTATEALPLEVSAAVALDPGAIVAAPAAPRAGPELSAQQGGVFAHDTDPRRLGDERTDWRKHAAASTLMPLATLGLLAAHGAWRRHRADPRALRRRQAVGRARARLAAAGAAATDATAAAQATRAALLGLVADLGDHSESALTAREAGEALAALGVTPTAAAALRELLERFDALRFAAPDPAALAELRTAAATRLEELAAELARIGALR